MKRIIKSIALSALIIAGSLSGMGVDTQSLNIPNIQSVETPQLSLKMHYDITPRELNPAAIQEIEKIISYKFKDKQLLIQAFTSRSKNAKNNYEPLEFFGDKIMGFLVTEMLMNTYPNADEGGIASAYQELIRQECLAALCIKLNLHHYIQIKGQQVAIKIAADIIESLIAAIYLDGKMEETRDFIIRFFKPMIEGIPCPIVAQNIIEKYAQKTKRNITYTVKGSDCIIEAVSGYGLVKKVSVSSEKNSKARLKKYFTEREFIKSIGPEYFTRAPLIRLAIDDDYRVSTDNYKGMTSIPKSSSEAISNGSSDIDQSLYEAVTIAGIKYVLETAIVFGDFQLLLDLIEVQYLALIKRALKICVAEHNNGSKED